MLWRCKASSLSCFGEGLFSVWANDDKENTQSRLLLDGVSSCYCSQCAKHVAFWVHSLLVCSFIQQWLEGLPCSKHSATCSPVSKCYRKFHPSVSVAWDLVWCILSEEHAKGWPVKGLGWQPEEDWRSSWGRGHGLRGGLAGDVLRLLTEFCPCVLFSCFLCQTF